jgi:hypothetical protein
VAASVLSSSYFSFLLKYLSIFLIGKSRPKAGWCKQKKLLSKKQEQLFAAYAEIRADVHFVFWIKHPPPKRVFIFFILKLKFNKMASKSAFINKLKQRWGITSTFQIVLILIVFACTGMSVLYAEGWVYSLFGIPAGLDWHMRVLLFILLTLPLYNVLLLFYGLLFGQFGFFWNYEKQMLRRLLRLVMRRREV